MLVPYWISHKMDFPIVFQQGGNYRIGTDMQFHLLIYAVGYRLRNVRNSFSEQLPMGPEMVLPSESTTA